MSCLLGASLSTGDTIELVALLLGSIFGVSFLFQRIGEARLKHLVALREEVDQTVAQLNFALADLASAQRLTSTTIERVVSSLDIITAYMDAAGGVVGDVLDLQHHNPNTEFVATHSEIMTVLRRANDELRVLSADTERRHSAVKNLAFGQANYRALEVVEAAQRLYPQDEQLARFVADLKSHLRGGDRSGS